MPEPKPKGKPFWQSKSFWGNVVAAGSIFVPAPLRPIVAVVGAAVGLYGRATATEPLDFTAPKVEMKLKRK